MPVGQLTINGKDAFTTWGISLSNTALSALMTPVPNKDYVENESRLEHGKRILNVNPKMSDRTVTIFFNLIASDEVDFFRKYGKFCTDVLQTGEVEIKTSFQPTVVYRMKYISCNQFTQFMRGIAKFSLKLVEPNPDNRAV